MNKQLARIEKPHMAKAQIVLTKTDFEAQFTSLSPGNNFGPPVYPGYVNPYTKEPCYHEVIKVCRWFYKYDPVAGTVLERMADMAITTLKNKRRSNKNSDVVDDVTYTYYNCVAERLRPLLKHIALEFLLHGMAVPDYTLGKIRGNLMSEKLGRKRYTIPETMWVRNPENLVLKRSPINMDRRVFFKIPKEDIDFVLNEGVYSDGTEDFDGYKELVANFPEYVRAIKAGKTVLPLPDVVPILRKITSFDDYPTPYLQKAVKALQHKEFLKTMDRSIASRAIEAMRHVKVGDKDFPADDDDITATKNLLSESSSTGERVFNFITNHTIEVLWVFPPLEALLAETKYSEPNADIFLGLGFPRIFVSGETLRSNSSDSRIASLGPKATMDDMRDAILVWVRALYQKLAEENELTNIPDPYFSPIATTDLTALIQYANEAMKAGNISSDTVAQLWNSDFETENAQREYEEEVSVLSPEDQSKQRDFENQQKATKQSQQFQEKQSDVAFDRQKEMVKLQPKPAAPKSPNRNTTKNGNTKKS